MSLRDLVIQFKENGFKDLDKKINTIDKKAKNGINLNVKGSNKINNTLNNLKSKIGDISKMGNFGGLTSGLNGLTSSLTTFATSGVGAIAIITALTYKIYGLTKAWSANTEAMYLNSRRSGLNVRDFQVLTQAGKEYAFTQEDIITATTKLRGILSKNKDKRDTSTAFKDISESIKNAKTQTEALMIAEENFGRRSGGKLVEFLKTGKKGFDDLALSMGKGIISDDTIRDMQIFQDKMNTIQKQMDAIKNWFYSNVIFAMGELGTSFWNMIEPIIDGIMSILAPIINIIATIGTILFTNLIPGFKFIGALLNIIGGVIDIIYTGWSMIIASIYKAIDAVGEWLDKLLGVKKWFDNLKNTTLGKFITYLVGGEVDGRTLAGDLKKERESMGLEDYRNGKTKTKPMIIPDMIDTIVTKQKISTKSSGGGSVKGDDLLNQVIMFKNQFILFANQLLGLQKRGSVGTVTANNITKSQTPASQTIYIDVNVGTGTNDTATGKNIGEAIVKELEKIHKTNIDAVVAIKSHETTVKNITGGKSASITPAPAPQTSPVGV